MALQKVQQENVLIRFSCQKQKHP